MKHSQDAATPRRGILGWVLLAALALYTVVIFYGVGVPPASVGGRWYEPRSFLFDVPGVAGVLDGTWTALVGLGLPALLLAAGVLLRARSAVAGALAVSFFLACLLFTFYGVQAPNVWEFFGWRGSAVLWLLAAVVGFALTAPLLAASWLRLGWPLRLLLYLPLAVALIALIRNATGTDPSLKYSISPWPAIPVFGIEVGAVLVFSWLSGAAVGAAALTRPRTGASGTALRAAGLGLGLALPVALLLLGSALGLLPFRADGRVFAPAIGACMLTVIGVATLGAAGVQGIGRRARRLAVGAALVGLPLVAGQAWARWDYYQTRERDARSIIDALDSYYEREETYPDSLMELTKSGDLERIPTPSIGFSFLYDAEFRYQNNGPDFILEFPAPRWVECAYTPPFEDEDDYEPDVAAGGGELEAWELEATGGGSLDESWSCPSAPPELW